MNLLQAYDLLAREHGLNEMTAGGLAIETRSFNDPDALWHALEALKPQLGWLQFQSWQGLLHDGLPEMKDDWGLLLQAEAVCADSSSLHIGPDGRGGWLLTHYRPQEQGDLIWDEVEHIAHDGAAKLIYRRYWKLDDEQGLLQTHAILQRIEAQGED